MSELPSTPPPTGDAADGRPALRPLTGLPSRRESRWGGPTLSLLLHALLVLLLFLPTFLEAPIEVTEEGAGGPGPAGGGGGGRGGTGGVREERLQYMQVAPAPPALQATLPPVVPPPVKPPEPAVVPPPTPPPTETKTEAATASTEVTSVVAGVGGGSGNDGSAGSGPGRGGGVGSGVGTGRGSGTGPGTGGGTGAVYPPTPTTLATPPLPVPGRVKGHEFVVVFEVDSLGNSKVLQWNRSSDNGYNQRFERMLRDFRFRPAVRAEDGRPVTDTTRIVFRTG